MKRYILIIICSTLFLISFSQKRDITLKEYFADAEFFFADEEYADALQDYLEIYKRGYDENANINYHIGVCYVNLPGQKEKSVNFLIKASQNASSRYTGSTLNEQFAPLDVFLYLGNAYRILYELDKAIESYNEYLELLPAKADKEKQFALKQIEACNISEEFLSNPRLVEFTDVASLINTSNSNHNCVVSGDGTTLIFMTKLPFYEAVFMSKRRGNNWSRPINITPQLMSDGDQFVTGISFDGTTLLLAKEGVFDSDILISEYENGKWGKAKPISKTINSRYWESHASFSRDAKTIYFTSNRRGGFGEMDIYSTEMLENGSWSEPQNLGANINTQFNEEAPFVSEDGQTLYFSSQGHVNMGGYDFFLSRLSDTTWTGPENLQYPLCTTDDDLFYYPYKNGDVAYVQRIFEDGKGGWDIYLVEFPDESELEESLTGQLTDEVDEESDLQNPIIIEEIDLTPIYFDFDTYELPISAKELITQLNELLVNQTNITLKVIGHTDALGPELYNLKLSERRAEAVKNYFLQNGIDANRIEIIGMGEKQFIAINSTPNGKDQPESRKYNRRVEFELIGFDEDKIVVKRTNNVPEHFKYPTK